MADCIPGHFKNRSNHVLSVYIELWRQSKSEEINFPTVMLVKPWDSSKNVYEALFLGVKEDTVPFTAS